MAEYCIVAPPKILMALREYGVLGNYHLLLAHDVVKPSNRVMYNELFGERRPDAPPSRELIIMDNSVVELGKAVDLDMIVDAVQITQPNCIVLPDCYLDAAATIKSTTEACVPWYEKLTTETFTKPNFMVIPQGTSIYEFAECAEALMNLPHVGWWGVPRNLLDNLTSRREAIILLHAMRPDWLIHMFGFSNHMLDDVVCAQMDEVFSIDSAVPVRIPAWSPTMTNLPGRGNWWDEGTCNDDTIRSIKYARKIFAGAL